VVRGDLGTSIFTHMPVSTLIAQRLPATVTLCIAGMLLSTTLALFLGITAALKQRTPSDWVISGSIGLAISVPNFRLGILLILLFSVMLGWLPPGGRSDFTADIGVALKALIMPAFALALPGAVAMSRLVNASILEVLYDDYIRTVRAKGLAEPGGCGSACAAQCTYSGRHRDWHRIRSPAWRRSHHRVGIRLVRDWIFDAHIH
jgi:peptide/nickel transport system permease protein